MSGAQLIQKERNRQITEEEYHSKHDDAHDNFELSSAAICYATPGIQEGEMKSLEWPWEVADWKPTNDPVRNLVKAGALIAAEIDRLQRLNRKWKKCKTTKP